MTLLGFLLGSLGNYFLKFYTRQGDRLSKSLRMTSKAHRHKLEPLRSIIAMDVSGRELFQMGRVCRITRRGKGMSVADPFKDGTVKTVKIIGR